MTYHRKKSVNSVACGNHFIVTAVIVRLAGQQDAIGLFFLFFFALHDAVAAVAGVVLVLVLLPLHR